VSGWRIPRWSRASGLFLLMPRRCEFITTGIINRLQIVRWRDTEESAAPAEWVAIGFNREEGPDIARLFHSKGSPAGGLPVEEIRKLADGSTEWVAIIRSDIVDLFLDSAPALLRGMRAGCGRSFTLLLPWLAPPPIEIRNDGPVTSILCNSTLVRDVLARRPDCTPRHFCYRLVNGVANGAISVDVALVRQLPFPETPRLRRCTDAVVMMAHRGSCQHLDTALRFICHPLGGAPRVRVGLDVEDPGEYADLIKAHPAVEFATFSPSPVGPYVIRQYLAEKSTERLLIFHDSDDISCSDRFMRLHAEMIKHGCDFIGCHELRIDETLERIGAFRFPLDASGALRERPGHALLHPTGMIRRESFFRAGGLSTDQRVANDTQFLYRCYFHLKIRNADDFLYMRRRHPESLTEHPVTGMTNPLRYVLDGAWRRDFEAVKENRLELGVSSLRQMVRIQPFEIAPVRPARGRRKKEKETTGKIRD
jgi:hypothetical protein